MPASELDNFIEHAMQLERSASQRWLTVSFDDGYEDAWHYVVTRARRFPNVEYLLLVCPEKTENKTGFRWDLEVVDHDSPRDSRVENHRADLKSVVQCRYVHLFENAQLGNHTNCHFAPTALPRVRSGSSDGRTPTSNVSSAPSATLRSPSAGARATSMTVTSRRSGARATRSSGRPSVVRISWSSGSQGR